MTKGKADTVSKEAILGKYLSNYFDNVPEEHKGEIEALYNQILKAMQEYAQAYAQTESKPSFSLQQALDIWDAADSRGWSAAKNDEDEPQKPEQYDKDKKQYFKEQFNIDLP